MSKYNVQKLLERISLGDIEALVETFTLIDYSETDEAIVDEIIDGLDFACLLYSLGTSDHQDAHEFRKIVEYFQNVQTHESVLYDARSRLQQFIFERNVLERLENADIDENLRVRSVKEFEEMQYAIDFCKNDIATEEEHVAFYSAWIKEAKKYLQNPRFTSLSDTILDDLIEAVAAELDNEEDDDDE